MEEKRNSAEAAKVKRITKKNNDENLNNPGLDADHSSDTPYQYLDNDNDMISGNPDGESDNALGSGEEGESPLRDK